MNKQLFIKLGKAIILLVFVLNIHNVKAQTSPPIEIDRISLWEPLSGNYNYQVRYCVNMTRGFEFNSSTGVFNAEINYKMILPNHYNAPINPNNVNINTEISVGTLKGNFSVGNNGDANYNIPIELPAGTGGMTPELGITYNSNSKNGLLGVGFNLYGFSTINFAQTKSYFSSFIIPFRFHNNDNTVLFNGSRLDNHTTMYLVSNTKYKTDAGKIYRYDLKIKEKHNNGNSDGDYAYLLTDITDANGNYIRYHYHNDNDTGEWWPESIEYAGNDRLGIAPSVVIKFMYNRRADKEISYIDGMLINRTVVLASIIVESEGKVIKEYKFDYSKDINSHLNSITLKGGNNIINPTVFSWKTQDEANSLFHPGNLISYPENSFSELSGDFNGDGKTDILKINKTNLSWSLYSIVNNAFTIISSGTINWHFYFHKENYLTINRDFYRADKALSVDMDADGKSELVLAIKDAGTYVALQCFKFNNNSFNKLEETATYFKHYFAGNEPINLDFIYPAGDIMGDELPVLSFVFTINNEDHSGYCGYIYNKSTQTLEWKIENQNVYTNSPPVNAGNTSIFGDFDGDGVQELITQTEGNLNSYTTMFWKIIKEKVIAYDTNGTPHNHYFVRWSGFEIEDFPFKISTSEMQIADFNGDKISDIIGKKNGQWELYYCNGKTTPHISYPPQTTIDFLKYTGNYIISSYYHLFVQDFNGDGKSDVLVGDLRNVQPGTDYVHLYGIGYSNGADFEEGNISGVNLLTPFYWANVFIKNFEACKKFFGDYNGDGKVDYYDGENMVFFEPNSQKQLVHTIKNGLNERIDIQYKPLTDTNVYTKETNAVYPIADMQSPLHVVSNVRYDYANENPWIYSSSHSDYDVSYHYKGAKVHTMGKGLLGFHEIIEKNAINKTEKTSTYDIKYLSFFHYINYVPVLAKTDVWDWNRDIHLYTEDNFYDFYDIYNNHTRYSLRKNKTVLTNYLTKVETTTEYNDLDLTCLKNKTIITTAKNLLDPANDTWVTKKEYTFFNVSTGNYILGLPATEKTTHSKAGEDDKINYNEYSYNDDGTLRQAIIEPNNTKKVVKDYTYYPIGLVKTVMVTTAGCAPRTSYVEYDPKFRYAKKKTNQLGHTNTFEYDKFTGNLIKETDANGHSTNYQYDDLGRLIKTINPDGTIVEKSLIWTRAGYENRPEYALYANKTSSTGNPDIFVYYDKLGRELMTKTLNINGQKIFTTKNYDNFGRLIYESKPYISGAEAIAPGYFYTYYNDGTNRLKTKNGYGFAMNMKYSYDNTKTIVEDLVMNATNIGTTDATGHIIKSEDAGGSVVNTYYSNGLLKNTQVNGGPLIAMTYDDFGRQLQINDPDAGITNYEYNGFGELTKQTTPKGVVDITYDAIGRMKTRMDENENINTTWNYDTQANGIGMLANVTATNNYTETYAYDNLSRLQSKTIKIDGSNYTSAYSYDNNGKLSYYTYPSGFSVNYIYQNGYLKKIINTENNSDIWECKEINSMGQITKYQSGAWMETNKTFNDIGQVTSIVTGNKQHLEYVYNAKYQLASRYDINNNQSESFTYDEDNLNLNRLSKTTVGSQTPVSINYNANGNIESKTDVGSYTYLPAKIHAIDVISPVPECPISGEPQTVNYNSFNKASYISEDGKTLTIDYDANRSRMKTVYTNQQGQKKTKYYVGGNYEKEKLADGSTRELNYISGGDGVIAIAEKKNNSVHLFYVHKDMQGSYQIITNEYGDKVMELSFDAWGRRRNPNNWSDYNVNTTNLLFDRGYTGHEMLDAFSLINMNGRMYDPILARFLSPDIVVQNPASTQSYNRYSYCFNNPLAYTDPSGWLGIGGSQYEQNNSMADNARLRAMYSDAADAIYAEANASGAGNMYGVWEEGKLLIFSYSDISNFKETGTMNEAMKTYTGYTSNYSDISSNNPVLDAAAEREFDTRLSNNDYKGATNFIINVYNLNSKVKGLYSIKTYLDKNPKANFMVTEGEIKKNAHQTISIEYDFYKAPFGNFVRALDHELTHVYQKSVLCMQDKNEREFLAYYETIFNNNLPAANIQSYKEWSENAINRYNTMSTQLKNQYENELFDLECIKYKPMFPSIY